MKRGVLIILMALSAIVGYAIDVQRVEPANWWVGMENHELQVLLDGKLLSPMLALVIQA